MKIFKNISQLATPIGKSAVFGKAMNDIAIIENAEIVTSGGEIVYAGAAGGHNYNGEVMDCGGRAVLPGFVDSHTHLVFGGYRADEFIWRQSGISYMEIMNRGGGIMYTVKATQSTSCDELISSAIPRIQELSQNGVTTVEIKSGYGLDFDTEIKQLRAINQLKNQSKVDIVSTYMGAHAVPSEYKGNNMGYIDFMIEKVLPAVKKENLADITDIFCEKGVFSYDESKKYLSTAKEMGFKIKIHADEIVSTGGAELAAELGCLSADHLLHASDNGIESLASSKTVATLLPLTAFCLKEPYANARKLIDTGAAVALATDFNPGSCFSSSIPLLIAISVIYMKMSIAEVITALTLNGACALDLGSTHGSIEKGKKADFIVLKYPFINFLPYHTAVSCVDKVIKNGEVIH